MNDQDPKEKPKPYIDIAGLLIDGGFDHCTDEELQEMVKTGYIGHCWSDDIIVSKIELPVEKLKGDKGA